MKGPEMDKNEKKQLTTEEALKELMLRPKEDSEEKIVDRFVDLILDLIAERSEEKAEEAILAEKGGKSILFQPLFFQGINYVLFFLIRLF